MSTLKSTNVQLGQSNTATQNFTLTAAASDGTMKLARGNQGATTQDVLTVDSSGLVSFPNGVSTANSLPIFLVRAWGTCLGSTTGTAAPASGGNIATVTKAATGVYRFNFTTAMPNANYMVMASTSGTPGYNLGTIQVTGRTTTYAEVATFGITGTANVNADGGTIFVAVVA